MDLEPGFYQIKKLLKGRVEIEFACKKDDSEFTYPSYKDIIKDAARDDCSHIDIKIDPDDDGICSGSMAIVIRSMKENTINYKYLKSLGEGIWEGRIREEMACHFLCGNHVAIIMPRRIK